MKIVYKKNLLLLLIIINILLLPGCHAAASKGLALDFDFNRYYGQKMNVLMEDLGISPKDCTVSTHTYTSSTPLAFGDYEGYYYIICDYQDNVKKLEITIPFDELSRGYEIATAICSKYESLKNADYLANQEYRYTEHEFTAYHAYQNFMDDVNDEKSGYFVSQAAWNTDSSVQVNLKIKAIPDQKGSVVVSMMNSDSYYAIKQAALGVEALTIWQAIELNAGITATVRRDGTMHTLNFDQLGAFLDLLLLFKDTPESSDFIEKDDKTTASFSIQTASRDTYFITLYDTILVVDGQAYVLDEVQKDLFLSFLDTCFYSLQ